MCNTNKSKELLFFRDVIVKKKVILNFYSVAKTDLFELFSKKTKYGRFKQGK